eukprot:gene5089-6333_t
MKFKLLFLVLLINSVFGAFPPSCVENYQCGNDPYSLCYNRLDIALDRTIGINSAQGKLLFMARVLANTSYISDYATQRVYILSVPLDGSAVKSPKFEFEIKSSSPNSFYAYVESTGGVYIINTETRSTTTTGPYNPTTGTYEPIWLDWGSPSFGVSVDNPNDRMYRCDYNQNIYKIEPTPKNRNQANVNSTLYTGIRCNGITHQGSDIYVAVHNIDYTQPIRSHIYKGSTNCNNCPASQLVNIFNDTEYARSITSSPTDFFLASNDGIWKIPLSGDVSQRKKLSSDINNGAIYYKDGFLYYKTENNIKKLKLSDGTVTVLFDGNGGDKRFTGQCQCSTGFTGDSCTTCTNGLVRWRTNIPHCIPIGSDGFPTKCMDGDWECLNPPYTYCGNGKCYCRPGFTNPPKCDTCNGTISFQYIYPECIETTPTPI